MAREIRLGVAGVLYRLIVGGNDRNDIFPSRGDYERFLDSRIGKGEAAVQASS